MSTGVLSQFNHLFNISGNKSIPLKEFRRLEGAGKGLCPSVSQADLIFTSISAYNWGGEQKGRKEWKV